LSLKADDARRQLRLAQRQYCEEINRDVQMPTECDRILRMSPTSYLGGYCNLPTLEGAVWIFSLWGPYVLSSCGDYHSKMRWNDVFGLPYSRCFSIATILNRIPYCWEFTTPWYHVLGAPYTEMSALRPLLLRFPELHYISDFIRNTTNMGLPCISAHLLLRSFRIIQRGGFRVVCFASIYITLLYFSWRLQTEDLDDQANYWNKLRVREQIQRMGARIASS
jgi:hypothetical protein